MSFLQYVFFTAYIFPVPIHADARLPLNRPFQHIARCIQSNEIIRKLHRKEPIVPIRDIAITNLPSIVVYIIIR